MFRSLTILRELVQSLAKVTLLFKHSVKLCRHILCGDVAACREVACVLFVVQTDTQLNSIFICLFAYLFVFYIIFIHFHYSKKNTPLYYRHATTSPHNIRRRYVTECFNRSVTLARLHTSSLRMVEDRNM